MSAVLWTMLFRGLLLQPSLTAVSCGGCFGNFRVYGVRSQNEGPHKPTTPDLLKCVTHKSVLQARTKTVGKHGEGSRMSGQ